MAKSRRQPKVQNLQSWEFGDYNFRVGDLWTDGSYVIVIASINLHMLKSREWHSIEYYYLDDSKGTYICDDMFSFTNRMKLNPLA